MSSQVRSNIYCSLRVALQLVSDAAENFHESGLHPTEEHRLRLGRAMSELLGTIDWLCSSTSDLRRMRAEASKLEASHNQLFQSAMMEARSYEADGFIEVAIARYSRFLAMCSSHAHRTLARSEIGRLRLLLSLSTHGQAFSKISMPKAPCESGSSM